MFERQPGELYPQTKTLICASFFTRVFTDLDFNEAIRLARQYEMDNQIEKQEMMNATSADEVMYFAVKFALAANRLESKLRTKLEKIYDEEVY